MLSHPAPAQACTRVVYLGPSGMVLVARSMDWREDIQSNIWVLPRGIKRNGHAGPNSLKWKARYGSVVVSAYESGTSDGMNEKGLVTNMLWLAESEFPTTTPKGKKGLAVSVWAQYFLDRFTTVDEAVDAMSGGEIVVLTGETPGSTGVGSANVHLSISDSTGDSAIFEYIGGKLVIHHGRPYQVMTNSPTYDKQLALDEYWEQIGGTVMLPGTNRAADRFARASFYVKAVPQTDDPRLAVASMFSVIRNVSVPLGISTPNQPNIASTLWRVVADQKNLVYYYESTLTPNVFWLDLKDIDFSRRSGVRKLSVINQETYSGNAVDELESATAFEFMSAEQ
ncbi:MAG: linear amide C-N hydrolase [Myxococcota bacterium]